MIGKPRAEFASARTLSLDATSRALSSRLA